MVILQAILAALTHSFGRLLNTAFGWATVLLFGKVPAKKQIYISATAFSAVIWLVALVGVAFPSFATFLLAFVTLPAGVTHTWIRLVMFSALMILPAVVGALSIRMTSDEATVHGAGEIARRILRGYPFTLALAVTLVLMTVFAPIMRIRQILRRWTSAHIPVIIEPADYLDVVSEVEKALEAGGVKTTRTLASWMLRLPTQFLSLFARGVLGKLVSDTMTVLVGDGIEVLIHPSDLVVSGRALKVSRIQAILTEHLTFTKAYFTWDKEANEVEDRLRQIWLEVRKRPAGDRSPSTARARLDAIAKQIRTLELPYEEWEVLFRGCLQVERTLLLEPYSSSS